MPEHLSEHVSDWRDAVVVERKTRTIRNVALAGSLSKNGYRYSESALKSAAALYENVPVFLDHPASPHRPRDRSARDLAGSVTNARYESGRLRGDLRTLDTEAGRTLLALAETDGPGVGMSHVVLAERSNDGATVERIVEVISVDAVAFPATTSTFRESAATEEIATQPPVPKKRRTDTERVRQLMRHATEQAVARSTTRFEAGSLERVLAAIDAGLPSHLRRLALESQAVPEGRGVRVGVFPKHVVVEWKTAGGSPQRYAIEWQATTDDVAFGDALIPLDEATESLGNWQDSSNLNRETDDAQQQIEHLTQRLRQTAAERDQLTERLTAAPVTSALRRPVSVDRVADDVFVRIVRRR